MGEVYLAQDTVLDRRVALKILPREFAADADRLDELRSEPRFKEMLKRMLLPE